MVPHRSLESFDTNVIAENLYSQVNTKENEYLSLKVIAHDHSSDEAIKCTDKKFINGER